MYKCVQRRGQEFRGIHPSSDGDRFLNPSFVHCRSAADAGYVLVPSTWARHPAQRLKGGRNENRRDDSVGGPPRYLFFGHDTYEIFAFCEESENGPLGTDLTVPGTINLKALFGFSSASTDHSAQFMSDIQTRGRFWHQLMVSAGLMVH
jgi:hypothetical protein